MGIPAWDIDGSTALEEKGSGGVGDTEKIK